MFQGIQYMNNQTRPKPKGRRVKKTRSMTLNKKIRDKMDKSFKSKASGLESVPVAFSKQRTTGKPDLKHLPNGDVMIDHVEFIGDVAGSVAFATTTSPVNPGLPSSFPWLSQIAPNYESYLFEQLDFEYQNSVGSNTAGVVMLGVDYDASDPPPISKLQFASYQDYNREAPWKPFEQKNRRPNLQKRKSYYVRIGNLSANQDIKLYDTGNLFVGTQGMSGATNVGELYVKYRVRLMTPQLQNPAVGLSRSSRAVYTSGPDAIAVVAGSNAPLTFTGNATTATITASSAYSGLVSVLATGGALPVLTTTGSTATIENPQSFGAVTNTLGSYQVAWLAGQTLVINNTAGTPSTLGFQIGQFNTSEL